MGHASGLGAPSCDRAASCGGREVSYAAGLVAQLDESATRRLRPWKIKKLKKCFAMFDKDKNGVSRCGHPSAISHCVALGLACRALTGRKASRA